GAESFPYALVDAETYRSSSSPAAAQYPYPSHGEPDEQGTCWRVGLRNKMAPADQLNRIDVLVRKDPSDTNADGDRDNHWHDNVVVPCHFKDHRHKRNNQKLLLIDVELRNTWQPSC